jgi:hypothetical protein
MDLNYAWKITDVLSELWPGRRKTRNEVGKWRGKSDEAEEFNTWRRSKPGKPATMAKTDWEPVTGVTLEHW